MLPVPEPKLAHTRTLLRGVPLQLAVNVPVVRTRAPLERSTVPKSSPVLVKLQVCAAPGDAENSRINTETEAAIITSRLFRVKI